MKPLTRYTPYYEWKTDELGMGEWEHGDYYAKDEADACIAELERDRNAWRNTASAASALVAAAEAERDAALADAERYRWLKAESARFPSERMVVTENVGHDWIHVDDLDAAIDAARSKE